MSTIPFTPIEGYLALPRLRPLGHVPAPFGRDWALLPPGYSWRTELKALYAAMLRTFCLSDQAIRSLCRWSPLGEPRVIAVAAQPEPAATTAQATVFAAVPEAAMQTAVEAPVASLVVGPAYGTTARGYGSHWGALAGGACVLGGAAVLAWIGFGHLVHRQAAAAVAGRIPAHRSSQAPDLRSSTRVSDLPVGNSAVAPTFAPASSLTSATVSAAVSARAAAQTLSVAPAPISADKKGARRHTRARDTNSTRQQQNRPHTTQYATVKPSSHAADNARDWQRIAVPRMAGGLSARSSAAGSYSSFAPTRLGVDEYAGVTLSASTHLRDARPLHAVSSNNESSSTGTEWMGRLTQRRVTEIPDQFAK